MRKRFWLSPVKDEDSYMVVNTGTYPHWVKEKVDCFEADVILADCYKRVTIDFSMDAESKRKGRLQKVNKLIAALELLKQEIENHDFKPTNDSGS